MTAADRLGLAAEAHAGVARVIQLLQQPTVAALDRSAAGLSAVIAQIGNLNNAGAGGGQPVEVEIVELRKDLRLAALLLRKAWEFRAGLGGQTSYSREGELTRQTVVTGRVSLEG